MDSFKLVILIFGVVAVIFSLISKKAKEENKNKNYKSDDTQTVYKSATAQKPLAQKPIQSAQKTAQPFNLTKNTTLQKTSLHKHGEDGKSEYKIEKAPITFSAGGAITEGCGDHYFERRVKVSSIEVKTKPVINVKDLSKDELRKAFILGEVINKRKGR